MTLSFVSVGVHANLDLNPNRLFLRLSIINDLKLFQRAHFF